jgi:hypothetical protein
MAVATVGAPPPGTIEDRSGEASQMISRAVARRVLVRCSVLTEHRTVRMLVRVDTEALVVDALLQLGVEARPPGTRSDHGADLVLDPDGVGVQIW